MKRKEFFVLLSVLLMSIVMTGAVMADPLGATLTRGASSRGTNPSAIQQDAQAGNVTGLNMDQSRISEIWQGFYGNVTGGITLEDGASNAFYDWSLATIVGEVYATRYTIPDWTGINCTNSTHWILEETTLNIPLTNKEGINETYDGTTHPTFDVGTKTFAANACRSVRPFNSSGLEGGFYNVLLNSNSTNTVYTAVMSDDGDSFDGGTADFEILVPVDKDTGTATYYFYTELDA